MGADSTLTVSRAAALQKLFEQLGAATNKQLEDMLYHLWGAENLHNFIVLDTPTEPDDEKIRHC